MLNRYNIQNWMLPLPLVILSFLFISCENKPDYERLVEKELAKDVRYDSLFLGYELGMESERFFEHSWELNQKQIITGGTQVEYELEELSSPARMVFFPEFHEDRIYRMPVEISFKSWAPWNPELNSENLIEELVELYSEIYGPGFFKTRHPELDQEAWIKVDGNRRIAIFRKNDMTARVEFLDLSVQREKKEPPSSG